MSEILVWGSKGRGRAWRPPIIGLALGLLILALAQGAEVLKLTLNSVLVVQERKNGQVVETFQPALAVKPGEILEWRLEAENTTDRPLRQVALVIPIPKETVYLEGSALALAWEGRRVLPQFSYDGGKTYGFPPLKRRVRSVESGQVVEREVEVRPEEYTHVRWLLPELGPKAKVLLKLRTTVK